MTLTPEDEQALQQLRASLLDRRPRPLRPDEGKEAFAQHQVLATVIHRAVKLTQRGPGEGKAWVRYFVDFFPAGRNGEAEAKTLWEHWRTRLLKEGTPGPRVALAHGQSHIHWKRNPEGVLAVTLEDMWDDFAVSVENLIASLRTDHSRCTVVLSRWRERSWQVESFYPADAYVLGSASVSDTSITITEPPNL